MVRIGDFAPEWEVSAWFQSDPVRLQSLRGKVVLVEVFQVNCPGCFLYGLPEAIEVFARHQNNGLAVVGVATAFEDFDKNTVENLKRLLENGEVVGQTMETLAQHGWLENNKLRYRIPFPVGVDLLKDHDSAHIEDKVQRVIDHEVPNFDRLSYGEQMRLRGRIKDYLLTRELTAVTFENYGMRGTPTSLLIDKKGVLRHHLFGSTGKLDRLVRELLLE